MTALLHEIELESFGEDLKVAIVGANGGIGAALANQLDVCPAVSTLFEMTRSAMDGSPKGDRVHIDLEYEATIEAAADTVARAVGTLHLVIVATGILHDGDAMRPEKSWKEISLPALERAFRINAAGPALIAKHFLPLLSKDRKSAFATISARVGSNADNQLGGWYAYRASKAALNMLIKTLSIELARKRPQALCVDLHPGAVDTPLSEPFQRRVAKERLFTPDYSAKKLLQVLDRLTAADSGRLFAWDGSCIPV